MSVSEQKKPGELGAHPGFGDRWSWGDRSEALPCPWGQNVTGEETFNRAPMRREGVHCIDVCASDN